LKASEIADEVQYVLTLLLDEDRWCKRALARDKDGNQLFNAMGERACQWCIYGALYGLEASLDTIQYLQRCAKNWGWSDLDRLNDLNEHYYVIQFLQSALSNLGGWLLLKKPLEYGKAVAEQLVHD
jgi:hypothetical protein